MVYGVSTVVGRFLTFMLTPLYTNFLTASEIGDVTAVYAMIAFVGILYTLGLEPAFMRFWEKDNAERSSEVFRASFLGIAVLGVVVAGLTILLAPWIATSAVLQIQGDGATIIRIAALVPFFDALVLIPFARLRMMRRAKAFAMMRLAAIVVNVALNGLFVVAWDMRVEGVVLAGVLSSGTALLLFVPSILKGLREKGSTGVREKGSTGLREKGRLAVRYPLLATLLRFGLPTVPASFSSIMVQVVDRPLLLILTSSATVGLYQTNFRLAIPMMMFVTVFEYAWKPFYLTNRDEPDAKKMFARVLTVFSMVCGAVFLTTTLFVPYIVQLPFIGGKFINPAYWTGLSIVPIIMFAYFFNGIFVNLVAGLYIQKKTWWLPIATGAAAILNVVATLMLVPEFGIDGAAWAKVIAYVGSVVVLGWYVHRVYPITYDVAKILIVVLIAGGLYAVVTMVPDDGSARLIASFVALPAYVALLVFTRVLSPGTIKTLTRLVRRS